MQTFQIDFGSASSSQVVGIDLGTTNSLIAWMDPPSPKVIPNPEGGTIVPSVVSRTANGDFVVGKAARQLLVTQPERTVYSVKRLMGRGLDDIAKDAELFPFQVVQEPGEALRIQLGDGAFTPREISACILRQLKRNAEAQLDTTIRQAVITVPAYFNDAQRQATKDAGRIAGLEVLRLVNEPTAAALAYGLDKRRNGIVAVYDLGGGTFDISILRLHEGIFEVMATNGDTHLGGDDFDDLLLRIALEDVRSEWGEDLSANREAVQLLRRAVIEAKEKLSYSEAVTIEFTYRDRAYRRELKRELFDELIKPVVDRTLGPCRDCISDAGVSVDEIDEVVLVGGSTRVPLVRAAVERLFRAKPHTELNPEEVVALGAAVQAGILAGSVEDKLLLDVTPLSLGIETMGGVVSKLIHRNSTIPASATEHFTTAVDGQTNVLIHVVQGERELVKDNRSLARFDLKGIAPMPAGLARIEVRFLIDANGILNVAAKDLRTGKQQEVEVKPSYGLTDGQVEKMIRDSIELAEEDLKERQVREARVEADNILGALEKAERDNAYSQLSEEERRRIESAVQGLRQAYHGDDHVLIRSRIDELNTATLKLAETMMNSAVSHALKGTKI